MKKTNAKLKLPVFSIEDLKLNVRRIGATGASKSEPTSNPNDPKTFEQACAEETSAMLNSFRKRGKR